MSSYPRRNKPLLQIMLERYFPVPAVKSWLLTRHPREPSHTYAFEKSFSYACMYYPPALVPRGTQRHPYPQPFLDMGDVLLYHHVYDGIAVGTLYNKREKHALSSVFDSVMKGSGYTISGKPRTRNFAVDLRVDQLEVVEFAWMEDHSLIIACRRLVESTTEERRLVLSADLLFYEPVPPNSPVSRKHLLLKMNLEERSVICDLCCVQVYQSCECPNAMKREAPSAQVRKDGGERAVSLRDPRDEPTGYLAGAIGSWENYTRKAFHFSQTGSFFITSKRRDASGKMVAFRGPKHPVQYQFVCGQPNDTITLVKQYATRTRLCDRNFMADTILYGNGLSRGSHIGMLMDKNDDDISLQRDFQQANEYYANVNNYSYRDSIPSLDISNHVTEGTLPSQSTLSNDTVPSSDYGSLYTSYDVAPQVIQDPSQCTDMGSLSYTRPNEESPNSILLDRDEAWVNRWGELPEVLIHGLRHPNGVTSNEWAETNQTGQQIMNDQLPQQQRPLSTSSREVQEYMTVNEKGAAACRKCSASFQKRGNLARHIQAVHLKRKPFRCNLCKSCFGYKAHLKRHMVTHERNMDFRGRVRVE